MSGKQKKRERAAEAWGPWESRESAVAEARAGIHGGALVTMVGAYLNRVLSVQVFDVEPRGGLFSHVVGVQHFIIRRHDGTDHVTWPDKQRVKDEIAGPEHTAVEMFPPRSALVDERNLYHLWVVPPVVKFGVGLTHAGEFKRC